MSLFLVAILVLNFIIKLRFPTTKSGCVVNTEKLTRTSTEHPIVQGEFERTSPCASTCTRVVFPTPGKTKLLKVLVLE